MNTAPKLLLVLVSLGLSGALSVQPVSAESGERARAEAQIVYDSLMSPYCPGRLLRDCPSGQATELKQKILTRAAAGETGETIRESLIASFGEEMRATPRASGFGLMAWIAPGLFFFGGIAALVAWLRSRSAAVEEAAAPVSPELERRVAAELDLNE